MYFEVGTENTKTFIKKKHFLKIEHGFFHCFSPIKPGGQGHFSPWLRKLLIPQLSFATFSISKVFEKFHVSSIYYS